MFRIFTAQAIILNAFFYSNCDKENYQREILSLDDLSKYCEEIKKELKTDNIEFCLNEENLNEFFTINKDTFFRFGDFIIRNPNRLVTEFHLNLVFSHFDDDAKNAIKNAAKIINSKSLVSDYLN